MRESNKIGKNNLHIATDTATQMNTFFFTFFISAIYATLYVLIDQFGGSDLLPFLVWTIPLALLVSVVSEITKNYFSQQYSLKLGLLIAVLAIGIVLLCLFAMIFVLGPWIGALSIPILPAWLAGVFGGLLFGNRNFESYSKISNLGFMVGLGLFALLLGQVAFWAAIRLAGNQTVKLTFVEWQKESLLAPLNDEFNYLSDIESDKLAGLSLPGRLITLNQESRGVGPEVHVIIIVPSQMRGTIRLPIPKHEDLIYLLDENANLSSYFPRDAVLGERVILLEVPAEHFFNTYMIELPSGGFSGGGAFEWTE